MQRWKEQYELRVLCAAFEVSASGFYRWQRANASPAGARARMPNSAPGCASCTSKAAAPMADRASCMRCGRKVIAIRPSGWPG